MASLDDPLSKIARARKHLEELRRQIEPFAEPNAYTVTHDFNSETSEHVWKLVSDVPPVPIEVSLTIGDILYNLRSALDHLVWQLVLANRGTPSTRNAFPIFIDEGKFKKESASKLRGVSDSAKDVIVGLQPCYGGDVALWALESLYNIDKHRHLNVVLLGINRGGVFVPGGNVSWESLHPSPYLGPVEKTPY